MDHGWWKIVSIYDKHSIWTIGRSFGFVRSIDLSVDQSLDPIVRNKLKMIAMRELYFCRSSGGGVVQVFNLLSASERCTIY